MAQETYDWSSDYNDEDNGTSTTHTSGTGDTVEVTVSQPDPGGNYKHNGDGYEDQVQGGDSSGHIQMEVDYSNLSSTISTTIDFSSNTASGADSVTDPSFTIYDVDSPGSGGYQDQVTILAYDASGNLLPVTLTAVDPSVVIISGSTATAVVGAGSGGSQGGNVADGSTEGNVQVSISGEVSQIVIVYGNGSSSNSNPTPQQIGISDITFDLQPPVVCFTRGTYIETPGGQKLIEQLSVGDLVVTADHGAQPIVWIGKRRVSGRDRLAPVKFMPGTIGNERTLLLSPQHRVVLTGYYVSAISGHDEVLVTAQHLVNGNDIIQEDLVQIEYIHLMFDRHEVIFAEGSPCESLFISALSLRGMGQAGREEVERLFTEIYNSPRLFGDTARPCLREFEARLVA